MNQVKTNNRIWAPIHLLVIIVAYSSPFWLGWKLIIAAVALYFLQLAIFKGCILSTAQFGKGKPGFTIYYTKRALLVCGLQIGDRSLWYFYNLVLPLIIITVAWLWQDQLNHRVFLDL